MHDLDDVFSHKGNPVIEFLQDANRRDKKIVLFGAGITGRLVHEWLSLLGFEVEFFCDNASEKWGTVFCGQRVISPEELVQLEASVKVIICGGYYYGIWLQLQVIGIKNVFPLSSRYFFSAAKNISLEQSIILSQYMIQNQSRLKQVYDLLADEQSKITYKTILKYWHDPNPEYIRQVSDKERYYFSEPFLNLRDDEVLIDGGAMLGDTVYDFCFHTNSSFKAIHCFEPNLSIYKNLQMTMSGLPEHFKQKIQLHNAGLYSRNTSVHFKTIGQGSGAACIAVDGDATIDVVDIDSQFQGQEVSFIKMDIEGAELDALKGAQATIQRYKPKLAICIYHKPEDFWEIPLYIKSLLPEYKLYIRQKSYCDASETVCYAVI